MNFEGSLGYVRRILKKVNFDLPECEITGLAAPGGSGKSTLMKILAGIYIPSSGEVIFTNTNSGSKLDPGVLYIPSLPSSFPWFSVKKNIEYFLQFAHDGSDKSKEKINYILELVGLKGYEDFHPDNKSYGFRFRIALARSLAVNPRILLIDEPFNKMEAETKEECYLLLKDIQKKLGLTILLSGSDLNEIIFLSDSIILLGKSPAECIGHIRLNLPVKRDYELFKSSQLNKYLTEIQSKYEEHGERFRTIIST